MDLFTIMIVSASVTALVMTGIMIASASAKKIARDKTSEWLDEYKLTEYAHKFETGDAIAVDYDRSIVGVSCNSGTFIIPFYDLLSVEIFENGNTIQKTNRASQLAGAAVGGAALGVVGAVIGGLSAGRSAHKKVFDVGINIITKSRDYPFFKVSAYVGTEIDKDGFIYNQITAPLMPCYGRLKAIIEQQP